MIRITNLVSGFFDDERSVGLFVQRADAEAYREALILKWIKDEVEPHTLFADDEDRYQEVKEIALRGDLDLVFDTTDSPIRSFTGWDLLPRIQEADLYGPGEAPEL